MRCLSHRVAVANVESGSESQAANQSGGEIAQNVAKHVRDDNGVESLRLNRERHGKAVDVMIIDVDVREFTRDFASSIDEQSAGQFKYRSLVNDRNARSFALPVRQAGSDSRTPA